LTQRDGFSAAHNQRQVSEHTCKTSMHGVVTLSLKLSMKFSLWTKFMKRYITTLKCYWK